MASIWVRFALQMFFVKIKRLSLFLDAKPKKKGKKYIKEERTCKKKAMM